MLRIAFAPHRVEMTKKGRILRTIRRGHRYWPLGSAVVYDNQDESNQVSVNIWSVQHTRLKDVSVEDFGCEFATQAGLIEGMQAIYPDLTPESEVTIARWTVD